MNESRWKRALRDPLVLPRALLRRLLPRHSTFGFHWIHLEDGSITFREPGFVEAASPAMLLARHNYERAYVDLLLGGQKFERSLEIGCGFGRLTPIFAKYSDSHTAVDINDEALALAQITYPQHRFLHASASKLPFPENHFDLITTWTVLQHIPPAQVQRAAAEIQRVSRPGATLLLCEKSSVPTTTSAKPHTWGRSTSDYAALFSSFKLISEHEMVEIDRLPGMSSPGQVTLWRRI